MNLMNIVFKIFLFYPLASLYDIIWQFYLNDRVKITNKWLILSINFAHCEWIASLTNSTTYEVIWKKTYMLQFASLITHWEKYSILIGRDTVNLDVIWG